MWPRLARVSRRHRSSIQNGRSSVSTTDSAQDQDLNGFVNLFHHFIVWLLASSFFIDSATKSQTSNYKSPVKMNVHMHSPLIQRLSALPR